MHTHTHTFTHVRTHTHARRQNVTLMHTHNNIVVSKNMIENNLPYNGLYLTTYNGDSIFLKQK